MAKIIRKGRDLEKAYIALKKKVRRRMILSVVSFSMCIISGICLVFFLRMPLMLLTLAFGVASIVSIALTIPLRNEMDILESGIDGEDATNSCIATLPESYMVFRNLTVSYQDKTSEIDTVIIGPTGIFIVETKNVNGQIYGDINDTHWTQDKVGRGGTPYTKTFYSPVKQVNTQVYRIANYLRENEIRVYINPIVYFSNMSTEGEISGADEKTPVFFAKNDGESRMLQYIRSNSQKLPQDLCDKIRALLIRI